jgi:hypothetical protein
VLKFPTMRGAIPISSRRHFLQAAAAASLVPFAARVSLAATDAGATVRPWLVVAETRSAAAAAFAAEAGRWGIPVRPIDGDVTALWYDELDALWRARPMPIAGLTARPALFCLERLAWDHGMRVVYHAEHTQRADGTFAHVARMPVRGLNAAALAAEGERWSGHVASVLARLPAESAVARGPSTASTAAATDETATVFSWMISATRRS